MIQSKMPRSRNEVTLGRGPERQQLCSGSGWSEGRWLLRAELKQCSLKRRPNHPVTCNGTQMAFLSAEL